MSPENSIGPDQSDDDSETPVSNFVCHQTFIQQFTITTSEATIVILIHRDYYWQTHHVTACPIMFCSIHIIYNTKQQQCL